MRPLYIRSGADTVAAIYQPAPGEARGTAVLIVPPFGWDDQTSYRPRREWSLSLAEAGFANLRIDLPGTGDSSGNVRDEGLVDSWVSAVTSGVEWLRGAGALRVCVIALGSGGLVTLGSIAAGTKVDDLVLWGLPANGRSFVREFKAFGRLEQSQTGEPASDAPEGELHAGGHLLTADMVAALAKLDAHELVRLNGPRRAFIAGRDGSGPDGGLVEAMRASGIDVRTDQGRGWGAALARPQSVSPTALFATVNAWLAEAASVGGQIAPPAVDSSAEIGEPGSRIRETAVLFDGAGQQLYGVIAEPVDVPAAPLTLILFNAGAIRRIGPNRMWTEAARRWAAAGVPALRVDIEGIGDAGGDGSPYRESDDPFYTDQLIQQARAALDLAVERGLPDRFALGGLCSGGFWGFQAALADPRVRSVIMLNPRLLFFDPHSDGQRELRKLLRLFTPAGMRALRSGKLSWKRAARLGRHLLRGGRRGASTNTVKALQVLSRRGQHLALGFSGDEPLYEELQRELTLGAFAVSVSELPYKSHTLKPFKAQGAGHSVLDEGVRRALSRS